MDIFILLYQSVLPKLFYSYLLYKFIIYFNLDIINIFFLFIIILSILFGSIGSISQYTFKKLIAYSSILNTGYILIPIILSSSLNIFYSIERGILSLNLYHYLIVYSLNTILLFILYINTNKPNHLFIYKKFNYNLYSLFCLIICIFSLIGFPPLGGFYIKLPIIIQLYYTYNVFSIIIIIIIIISSIISSALYLNMYNNIINNIYNTNTNNNHINYTYLISIIISIITILLLLYPIYIYYILSLLIYLYI